MKKSSRDFCLRAPWALVVAAMGCGPAQLPQQAGFAVEVVHEEAPVVGRNQLSLRISSPNRRPQSLIAYLELISTKGERSGFEHSLQVSSGDRDLFNLPFEVREEGLYRAALKIYDQQREELIHAQEDLRLSVRPRWEFSHDRSYYTTEEVLRFRARLNRPDAGGRVLEVELRQGATPRDRKKLFFHGPEVEGEIAVTSLLPGTYTLLAHLFDEEGLEDSLRCEFHKYLPGEREVKIDLFSQVLLVDGEPFFPIGIYWLRTEVLSEVRRLNFNAGDYFYQLKADEIAVLMDAAAREGIGVLLELSDFVGRRPAPDYLGIEATIRRYRRHPALLAWYIVDEPLEKKVDPGPTRMVYERIRELDPYHPVYLVNNRPHAYADYIEASDILGIDVYPIPKYSIARVRNYMEEARWASWGRKPVWLVAQAFGGVEHWPRAPTAVELRNMVYQGLAQGARGLLFYRYCQENERHIQPRSLWLEVRTLATELAELAPVLVEPDCNDCIRSVERDEGVDIMLKNHRGEYYLFAVNSTHKSKRVRCRFSGLRSFSEVEAMYHSSSHRWRGDVFEVRLAPLGVGVYRLAPVGV